MPIQPTPGQILLYAGQPNAISQEWQLDGTVIVTLGKHGSQNIITMHVQDLYGPNETVLSETTQSLATSTPVADAIKAGIAAGTIPNPLHVSPAPPV